MIVFAYDDGCYNQREQVEYILKIVAGFDPDFSFVKKRHKTDVKVIGDAEIMAVIRDNKYAKFMRVSNAFSLDGKNLTKLAYYVDLGLEIKTRADFVKSVIDDYESQKAVENGFVDDYTGQELANLSQMVVVLPAKIIVSFLRRNPYYFSNADVDGGYKETTLRYDVAMYDNLVYKPSYMKAVENYFRDWSVVQKANNRVQELREKNNENEG